MTILEVIRPIITRTYGDTQMSRALALHLSERIAGSTWNATPGIERTRSASIAMICWDWMSGATTATAVANQIEAALVKAGY